MKTKLLLAVLLFSQMAVAQIRREINLKTWDFSRDNQSWTKVDIPHDWAIAGPFDKKWDLQKVAIAQNGETEASEKSGRSGALPWIGEGWYKTSIDVPAGYEAAELVFDGAMADPHVFINGQEAGHWAYGYNAFRIDATPYLKAGKLDISVHLQNVEESSRWYPGAGLYRPVTLILKQKAHFDDWSLYARTISIEKDKTIVEVEGRTVNARGMHVFLHLAGPAGEKANNEVRIEPDGKFYAKFVLRNPQLWTPETPNLYTLNVWLSDMKNMRRMDSKTMKIGVRTVRIDREHGFQLNGKTNYMHAYRGPIRGPVVYGFRQQHHKYDPGYRYEPPGFYVPGSKAGRFLPLTVMRNGHWGLSPVSNIKTRCADAQRVFPATTGSLFIS